MKKPTIMVSRAIRSMALIALASAFGFLIAGCDQPAGTEKIGGKTPLSIPANVRIDDAGKTDFTLRWDNVEGVDRYELDIDGELILLSSSRLSYDLRSLTNDPKVYPIRVRALAANGDEKYKDSPYSTPLNVEPAEYVFTYDEEPAVMPNIRQTRNITAFSAEGLTIKGLTPFGMGLERVVIPPKIGSSTITSIGNDAFKDNNVMTSVSLPQTIITIGAGAFSGTDIASIVIPDTVLNIGDGAFSNCFVLVVIVFVAVEPPALGDGVFEGSEAIETIVVPEGSTDNFTTTIEEKMPEHKEKIKATNITSIEIAKNPAKTTYTVGETFSPTGIEIVALHSDGSKQTITAEDPGLSFSHRTFNTIGTIAITVYYEGRSAAFTVTVNPAQKTLTSIEVSSNPTQTSYTAGETLNPEGIELIATFSDGTQEIITAEQGLSFSPRVLNTAGTITITVIYQGRSAKFTVTVSPATPPQKTLTGIEVARNPAKTSYTVGETFSPEGIEIIATYSDDSKETITAEDSRLSFSPVTFNAAGTIPITVTYQGRSATFTVTVVEQGGTQPGEGNADLTINFAITDAHITSQNSTITELVLYRTSGSGPQTAELMVQDSSQYGSSIKWKIQNTGITGTGDTFTIQASNQEFIPEMEYFVTVELIRNSVPYSKTILLTIIGDGQGGTQPGEGNADLTINFAITDAHITNGNTVITALVLSRSAVPAQTAVLTVQDSSQYGSSIKWKIQNTGITGTGGTFTIQASNQELIPEMEYFVTVELMKGGIPYNKTILLTVRN